MTKTALAKIVVLVSGSGSNLQAIIDACDDGRISGLVALVVSDNPDAFALKRAQSAGIQTVVCQRKLFANTSSFDAALLKKISAVNPDLVVLAGFMRILGEDFVSPLKNRLINIHPSLLPKYQGLNTHQRVIENSEKKHGASVHFVTLTLDDGPIIIQGKTTVTSTDDAVSLATRVLLNIEHEILPIAVSWICEGSLKLDNGKIWLNEELLPESGFQYKAD